jgi:hypothetical protein
MTAHEEPSAAIGAAIERALPGEPSADKAGEPSRPPPPTRARSHTRVLLLGSLSFNELRRYQSDAPSPRMDMRYHVEGLFMLLDERSDLREDWLSQARFALARHLAEPARSVRSLSSNEGAQARTHGEPERPAGPHQDCRSLHVQAEAFDWLQGVQGTTHDPRLELRWLVDGALALVQQRRDLHPQWVTHARKALHTHLAQLQSSQPFASMESSS